MKTEQTNTWQHFIMGLAFIGAAYWSNIEFSDHVLSKNIVFFSGMIKLLLTVTLSVLIGFSSSVVAYYSITRLCKLGKTIEKNLNAFTSFILRQRTGSLGLKIFALSFLIVIILFLAKMI